MKKLKYEILFIILFITVGVAAVSSNLLINGSTSIASNPDDFNVYFSQILNESHSEIDVSTYVHDTTKFTFNAELSSIDHYVGISFYVTNSSKLYDADVSISCTGGEDYLHVWYEFSDNIVPARETRMGRIQVFLIRQTVSENLVRSITCELNAEAIERSSNGSGVAELPVSKDFSVGEVVAFGDEKFNVISDNGDTVTMLAQFNIDSVSYTQSSTQASTSFSNSNGWDYQVIKTRTEWFVQATNPSDIDIQVWGGDSKNVLNEYILNLQNIFGDNTITGDIISFKELRALGCEDMDSEYMDGMSLTPSCANSPYLDILANGQYWWIRTPFPDDPEAIYFMMDKSLAVTSYTNSIGVRPIVTIKKETLSRDYFAFSIDGSTFTALKGMTWEEWIDSSFNDGTIHISTYLMQRGIYIKINGNLILPSEKIVENGTYILEY